MVGDSVIRRLANSQKWRLPLSRLFAQRSFSRRLKTADGACDIYVTPSARLNVLHPLGLRVDPVHARFIARWVKHGSVVWDIGGNMGLFSFPAALKAKGGQVYTFEPDIELASNMLRSLRRQANARLNIKLMPFALSDRDDVAELLISAQGRAMNKLAGSGDWHRETFRAVESRPVITQRIDTVAGRLRMPDIVKIDVEGAEICVLQGGRETIGKARPVMLIEGPSELAHPMKAYLDDLDYVIVDGQDETEELIEYPVWDTVAVPRERWAAK